MEGIPLRRPLLVGVSGGRDSMALLQALRRIGFHNLIVCHLDHGLRGRDSRADARFVRKSAAGLDFELARARTKEFSRDHGCSIELAARDVRRAFFRECARRRRCRTLVLAHHADDQIETCLFQFFRGSGAAGLAGMRPSSMRDGLRVLRPLLGVRRNQIDAFADEEGIAFREDSTNAEFSATRNRIRHQVIPAIRQAFGESFGSAILRSAEIFRWEEEWAESQVPHPGKDLDCAALRVLPEAIRQRTILRWLRNSAVPEPGFAETRRVAGLLDAANGPAKVSLPGNHQARRRAGKIFLEKDPGKKIRRASGSRGSGPEWT